MDIVLGIGTFRRVLVLSHLKQSLHTLMTDLRLVQQLHLTVAILSRMKERPTNSHLRICYRGLSESCPVVYSGFILTL